MTSKSVESKEFLASTETGTYVVDFWAPWCTPCTMMAPVLEEVEEQLPEDVSILKINIDEHADLAQKHHVFSIPTLLLLKDGEVVDRLTGIVPADSIHSMIQKQK